MKFNLANKRTMSSFLTQRNNESPAINSITSTYSYHNRNIKIRPTIEKKKNSLEKPHSPQSRFPLESPASENPMILDKYKMLNGNLYKLQLSNKKDKYVYEHVKNTTLLSTQRKRNGKDDRPKTTTPNLSKESFNKSCIKNFDSFQSFSSKTLGWASNRSNFKESNRKIIGKIPYDKSFPVMDYKWHTLMRAPSSKMIEYLNYQESDSSPYFKSMSKF